MSNLVSTALTPTGSRSTPVRVNIDAPVAGAAEASEAWESNDNQDFMQQQQQLLQQPAEFLDSAQPRINDTIIQGPPAAAGWQQMPESGSDATYSHGPESTEQNASFETVGQYAEAGSNHSASAADTGRIKGSPALEAMQSMTAGGSAAAGGEQTQQTTRVDSQDAAWQPFAQTETSQTAAPGSGATATDAVMSPSAMISPSTAAPSIDASRQSTAYDLQSPISPGPLAGRSALLVAAKPSALLGEVARSLVKRGARVTLAVKHVQDGQLFVKKLQKQLSPEAHELLNSTTCPINFASQTSVRQFASAINASDEQLDLLLLHTLEPTGIGRRWYTPEGIAGTAQVNFLGPATLLRLLEPKLSACGTSVLLTTTPLHRLGKLDDAEYMMTTWAGASAPDTELALLAYARQMTQHMRGKGLTVAAVDMGPLREQPVAGSLLRKVPPLHQMLHLLLPSARDTAHLMISIAEAMVAEKWAASGGTATATSRRSMDNSMSTGSRLSASGAASLIRHSSGQAGAPGAELGHGPACMPSSSRTARAMSACMGAQDAGFGSASDSAEDLRKLEPRMPSTSRTARAMSACMGAQDAGLASASDSAEDLPKLAAPQVPSTSRTARTISACMGAQDAGLASASDSAENLPKLAPAHNEGESLASKAGEQLGADLKLLEALMQHEGGHAAAEGAATSGHEHTETTEAAAEGVAGPGVAPGSKAPGARDDSFAAAPAGAVEDSFSYPGWGVLQERQKQSQVSGGQQGEVETGTAGQQEAAFTAGGAPKSFRYMSRGLLATPLVTSLDHAGRSSWLMHTFSSIMFPWYQITASSMVRGAMLLDWPVRAWLLAPAGAVSNFGKRIMGGRAARLMSQLQRGVPGVRGVPNSATPQWVEVTPAGLVMDDRLGDRLWTTVERAVQGVVVDPVH